MLTTHADDDSVLAALRAGARGYLTKDAGMAEIARAVAAADAGQALLDPQVQAQVLHGRTAGGGPARASALTARAGSADRFPRRLRCGR